MRNPRCAFTFGSVEDSVLYGKYLRHVVGVTAERVSAIEKWCKEAAHRHIITS